MSFTNVYTTRRLYPQNCLLITLLSNQSKPFWSGIYDARDRYGGPKESLHFKLFNGALTIIVQFMIQYVLKKIQIPLIMVGDVIAPSSVIVFKTNSCNLEIVLYETCILYIVAVTGLNEYCMQHVTRTPVSTFKTKSI